MKKVLAILLVLFVAGFVFAADADTSLTINTKIDPHLAIKISSGNALAEAGWEAGGITEYETDLTDAAVGGFYVNLRTNKKYDYAIKIKAPNMTSVNNTFEIGYNVKALTGDGTASSQNGVDSENNQLVEFVELLSFEGNTGAGLRILSHEFQIQLDSTDYTNAVEGDYSATITFNVVSD